jgi:hypothetical protein
MTQEEWEQSPEGQASIARSLLPLKVGGSDTKPLEESQAIKDWRETDEGKASTLRANQPMPFPALPKPMPRPDHPPSKLPIPPKTDPKRQPSGDELVRVFDDAGSTILRRKFFNAARDAVIGLRKKQGKNVSVQEFPGQGTIINVDRKVGTPTSTCYTAPSVTLSGIELNTACYPNGFCPPGCVAAQTFTDIGINDTFETAFFIGKLCDTCVYFYRPTVIHNDAFHCDDPCNTGSGCDGDPCEPGDLQIDIIVSRIDSTWYCQVVIIGGSVCPGGSCDPYPFVSMELFYDEQPYSGTPTDPVTFTNDLTAFSTDCTATFRSNIFFDTISACCTEGCGSEYVLAVGKNGTVTFTPVP